MSFFGAQKICRTGFSRTRRDILVQDDHRDFEDHFLISDSRRIYVVFIFPFLLTNVFSITYEIR